jgi:hypothetical protein
VCPVRQMMGSNHRLRVRVGSGRISAVLVVSWRRLGRVLTSKRKVSWAKWRICPWWGRYRGDRDILLISASCNPAINPVIFTLWPDCWPFCRTPWIVRVCRHFSLARSASCRRIGWLGGCVRVCKVTDIGRVQLLTLLIFSYQVDIHLG